jgi:hypothetical protein
MEAVCIPKREYVAKIATRRTVSSSRVLLRICKPVYRERKWFKEIIKVSSNPKNLRVDACARESARVQSFYAQIFPRPKNKIFRGGAENFAVQTRAQTDIARRYNRMNASKFIFCDIICTHRAREKRERER